MATSKESRNRAVVLGVLLANYAPKDQESVNPYIVAAFVHKLQKAANTAKLQAEHACNYPMTEAQQEAASRRDSKAEASLNASLEAMYANKYGVPAPTASIGNGDARGPGGMLLIPGMRGDGWNPENGFAVF